MTSKPTMQQLVDSIWRASFRQEKKKANHSLLPQYSSPTISASTTVTNFSSIQSLNKYEKYIQPVSKMTIKEKNMIIGCGEIAPLKIGEDEKSTHHFPEDQVGLTLEPSINGQYSPYNETTEPNPSYAKQVLAAISVSLGSMTVGFVSAYTSPAIVSMNRPNSTLSVTSDEASWIGSLMPFAALVGGIAGGSLIETIGRKKTILFTAFPFIMSWLLIAFAVNIPMLYAARVLAGFSVGVASLGLPVYLGETVQPEVRGTLGLLPTALGNIGILLCFTAGNYLNWSELAILGACLPIPFLLLMFIIPETPRWFLNKNKSKQARKALQWLRGDADVSIEFDKLQKSSSNSESSACSDLFQKQNIKPLAICLGLMFFQQLSGINAIIFYTVMIFQNAGSTIDENLCTIIVGVVNFGSTFVATILIDRLGRKVLLLTSSVSMTITLLILGTFFFIGSQGYDVSDYGWLPLVSFVIFVIGFSVGYGPIPWLMMGEILPSRIRGAAASICTAFNWACTFMVTKTFTDVIKLIGTHGAFWMFGTICLIAIGFTIICVPETRGRSLEDIEKTLTGIKVRRMSSIANLKPLPTAC